MIQVLFLLGLGKIFEVLCEVGEGGNHLDHFLGKLQWVMPWFEIKDNENKFGSTSPASLYMETCQPSICNLRYSVFLRDFVPVYPVFPVLAET